MSALALMAAAVMLAGLAFQLAGARLLVRLRAAPPPIGPRPPLTVLKPLCGAEPHLLDDLDSFWRDDWPALRMVCGIAEVDDPAGAVVRALQVRRPGADIRLVVTGPPDCANRKVANVLALLPQAGDGLLVIADSDMAAPPGYFEAVAAAAAGPGIGLATCLYVGRPDHVLWSRLGAMGINHGFLPAALVARALGRADGCFGATLALHRATLDRAGGLAVCADALADDHRLGQAVRELGLAIALAPVLAETRVHEASAAALWTHELRWNRTIAAVAPWSHAASVVVQPALCWLAALAGAWPLLPLALAGRWLAVRTEERALALPPAPPWLIVARDLLSLAVFVVALAGRTVHWRGRRYRIRRDGTLEALTP